LQSKQASACHQLHAARDEPQAHKFNLRLLHFHLFSVFFEHHLLLLCSRFGEEEAGRQNELLRLALQSIQDLNVAVHRRAEYCWRIISPDFRELFNLSSEKLIEASRMIILLRIQPSLSTAQRLAERWKSWSCLLHRRRE
jgi:hypothetical protein